jgi:hypothetical protein
MVIRIVDAVGLFVARRLCSPNLPSSGFVDFLESRFRTELQGNAITYELSASAIAWKFSHSLI